MAYRALDVARYIINYSNEKDYGVSNLKLQKLLYFVQAYYLMCDEICFNEEIEAWSFGPVVPIVYREFKRFGGCDIPTVKDYIEITGGDVWTARTVPYKDTIKKNDKGIIEAVIDKFANYSATDLVRLTHSQAPWRDAYVRGLSNIIKKESIREYFNGELG